LFVRLGYSGPSHWYLMAFIWPLTGWWSQYRFLYVTRYYKRSGFNVTVHNQENMGVLFITSKDAIKKNQDRIIDQFGIKALKISMEENGMEKNQDEKETWTIDDLLNDIEPADQDKPRQSIRDIPEIKKAVQKTRERSKKPQTYKRPRPLFYRKVNP